jgi:Gpi18-like mannosyltransferase
MIVLYHLARLDLSRRAAERAVALMAIFPFAFFFGVAYRESTFLLFTLLAFYRLRTGGWLRGGLAAGLAGATRVTGILMWPALAWTAWRRTEGTPRDRCWAVGVLALAASGFAAYCGYIYAVSGHPFLWFAALERWGYYPGGPPLRAPARLLFLLMTHPYAYLVSDRMALSDALNGVTAIGFALALPWV